MRVFSTCCVIVAFHVGSGCSPSSPQATKGGNEVRNEHKVVSVVREFLKYIENADYDHAIDLGTPGEFTRDRAWGGTECCRRPADIFRGQLSVLKGSRSSSRQRALAVSSESKSTLEVSSA